MLRHRCAHASSAGRSPRCASRPSSNNMGSPGCRPQRLPGRRSRKRLHHNEPNPKHPVAPVASRQHVRRRPNSNPPNNFGLLSPKTRQATPRDTRQHASKVSGAFCHWRPPMAWKLPSGKRPPTPSTSPPSPSPAAVDRTNSLHVCQKPLAHLADMADLAEKAALWPSSLPQPNRSLHVGQQQLADMADTAHMADLENQPTSAHSRARVCQKRLADSTRTIKRGYRERPSHERRSVGTVVPGMRRSAARDRFPNTPARLPGGHGYARDSRRR